MNKIALSIIFLTFLLTSCKKDDIKIDPNNPLLGIWSYSDYVGETAVYTRSLGFIDEPGYEFKNNGTLTERKNSGWCGTPPVSYANYAGTWSFINDTLIQLEVGYWGGITSYQLDIELVDSKYLKTNLVLLEK
jgi:hypothetical protein